MTTYSNAMRGNDTYPNSDVCGKTFWGIILLKTLRTPVTKCSKLGHRLIVSHSKLSFTSHLVIGKNVQGIFESHSLMPIRLSRQLSAIRCQNNKWNGWTFCYSKVQSMVDFVTFISKDVLWTDSLGRTYISDTTASFVSADIYSGIGLSVTLPVCLDFLITCNTIENQL